MKGEEGKRVSCFLGEKGSVKSRGEEGAIKIYAPFFVIFYFHFFSLIFNKDVLLKKIHFTFDMYFILQHIT